MPLPLDIEAGDANARTLTSPIHVLEVQLGELEVCGRDGYQRTGRAGQTIDGAKLRPPIDLTARETPCRVRIVYDSEAKAYEAERQRTR